ncbi:putative U3 small nucleolar RNA-associated protein 11 [Tasmannia lanceolata]|uniref:putative U3 small nucleolar RNA-associated protein 11 n=1 Tax=Tasmannia lanceolata TaxID=3420 RepID=UPI004062D65B
MPETGKRLKRYNHDHLKGENYFLLKMSRIRLEVASYKELEARKKRVNDLEKLYMDMSLQKELQKKGRKRKLREDRIVCPTAGPVYKWRMEQKR